MSGAKKFKRAQSVKWFKEVEMKKGAALGDAYTATGASGFAQWFHGMVLYFKTHDHKIKLLTIVSIVVTFHVAI